MKPTPTIPAPGDPWTGYAIARAVGCQPWPAIRRLQQLGVVRPGSGQHLGLDDRWPLAVSILRALCGSDPSGATRQASAVALRVARHFLDEPAPYLATDGDTVWSFRKPIDLVRHARRHPNLTVVKVNRVAPWAGEVLARVLEPTEGVAA